MSIFKVTEDTTQSVAHVSSYTRAVLDFLDCAERSSKVQAEVRPKTWQTLAGTANCKDSCAQYLAANVSPHEPQPPSSCSS